MSWMDSLVKRIDEAATLPVVVSGVLRVCDDPHSDAQDLAEVISTDPVLSAKLVRTADSVYGAGHEPTDDLKDQPAGAPKRRRPSRKG